MKLSATQIIPQINQKPGFTNLFSQAFGSSFALTIARAALDYDGLLMVLVADAAEVSPLKSEIEYFLTDTQEIPVVTLPDWETLPYDYFSPHQDIISERLQTLYQLPRLEKGILLLPVSSALQKLPSRHFIEQQVLLLKVGQNIDLDSLKLRLTNNGYNNAANVMEHGEFAIRGSIIDLFPMGAQHPIRIELFDDEIDSLRYFDPDTQLTTEKVTEINLLPAREYPTDESAIATFRQAWRATFDSNLKESSIYRDVSNGIFPAGIEYYLPLFFDELSSLFDFIDTPNLIVVHQGNLDSPLSSFWNELNERYEQYRYDLERPIVAPLTLFLNDSQLFAKLNQFPSVSLQIKSTENKQNTSPLSYSFLS